MNMRSRLVGVLVLAACAATAARAEEDAAAEPAAKSVETSADGYVAPKIGVFDFAAKKVQKALDAGDAAGAEAALLESEEKIARKPYYRYLLVKTAGAVRNSVQPQMTGALDTLTTINGRAKFTDNAITDVAAALNGASAALGKYKTHPLLQRPEFAMPAAAEINAQMAAAGGNLQKNAKAYFLLHDHDASNFFAVYPLQLGDEERRTLVAASDRWITVAMASEEAGRVLGQYLPWASEKMKAQARAALAVQLVKRNGWRTPLSVAQEFHLAAQLGLALSAPAENIAMVTIAGDGPEVVGVDKLQSAQSAHELDAMFGALKEDGIRYVLVRDLGRVAAWEQLKDAGKPATSKRVVGTRRVPNPAYARAQQAVAAAQQNLAAAQQRAASAAATNQMAGALFSQLGGGDNSQGWAALAGKAASGMASSSANSGVMMAQNQLNQAQMTLANTPTQIDEPVEEPYAVTTRIAERTKVQELAVYYVDLQRRTVLPAVQRDTQRKTTDLMTRFDPQDRYQQELIARNSAQMEEVRFALPADMMLDSQLARLDDPLSLVARAAPREGGDPAALILADAEAWENWKQEQLAANVAMINLDGVYTVGAEPKPEERREAAPAAVAAMPAGLTDPDSILWYETKAIGTIDAYEWYIERFPDGLRVGPAKSEIRKLKAAEEEAKANAEQMAQQRREEAVRAAQEAEQRRKDAAVLAQQRQEEEARAAQQRAEQQRRDAAAAAERKKKEERERREGAATIPSF